MEDSLLAERITKEERSEANALATKLWEETSKGTVWAQLSWITSFVGFLPEKELEKLLPILDNVADTCLVYYKRKYGNDALWQVPFVETTKKTRSPQTIRDRANRKMGARQKHTMYFDQSKKLRGSSSKAMSSDLMSEIRYKREPGETGYHKFRFTEKQMAKSPAGPIGSRYRKKQVVDSDMSDSSSDEKESDGKDQEKDDGLVACVNVMCDKRLLKMAKFCSKCKAEQKVAKKQCCEQDYALEDVACIMCGQDLVAK